MNSNSAQQPQRHHVWRVLRLVAINFVCFAVFAELASIVLVHLSKWPSSRPTYHLSHNNFFADINPSFGIWHRPNGHFFHQGGCYSVEYFTNSYGARDVERTLHATKPRTIVIGDSFVEGLGMPAEKRLTNLLEQETGREHLNFATSGGFSPLQYALLYKTLASKFDHDEVIVGVFPDNDFHEMDPEWLRNNYGGEYRPYYKQDLSVGYLGKFDPGGQEAFLDRTEAFLRASLASYYVGQYLYASRFRWRSKGAYYSGYNDFDETDVTRLKAALTSIKTTAAARGAKMAVFLIPEREDFQRWHERHTNRLGPLIATWGNSVGIPVKDLLPEMDQRAGNNYESYFLECDPHWSARGGSVAADILRQWLYQR